MAGDGWTTLACFSGNNSTYFTPYTVTSTAVSSLDKWDGLRGDPINSRYIYFGNTIGATTNGLNYEILQIAIYRGTVTDADLKLRAWSYVEASGSEAWSFADVTGAAQQIVGVTAAPSTAAPSPASIAVNNEETAYLIRGSAIGGNGKLTKQGSGTLTLTGANTFSGGVVIEGGTVVESGVKSFSGALGTGKNGSWANKITLKNGTFDINGAQNYRNTSQQGDAYWGWLSVQTLVLGGQADGVMEITGGVFGIGAETMITYDATNKPGKATISAPLNFTGTSSAATRFLSIGDSTATDVEVEFTGGMHTNQWIDGGATTIEKTGDGTMKISCGFGFKGLKVTRGKVLLGQDNLFMNSTAGGKFETLTLSGGTLDLGGTTQTLAPSAISYTSGALDNGTLALSAGTYAGTLAGSVDVTATGALSLTGSVSTTGTLRVAPGASLTLAAMPENATIEVDCSGLALSEAGTTWVPLIIPGISDTTRIRLVGEGVDLMSGSYDEATGNYTLTVNRAGKPLTWMAWGDSITEGERSDVSYRHALWNKLAAAGYDVKAVGLRNATHDQVQTTEPWSWHNAWYGATVMPIRDGVTSLYLNLDTALEAGGYPDLITVMIGTNDAASYTGTRGTQDLDARFAEWRTFIERMAKLRPHSQIIVATPPKLRSERAENLHTLIKGYRDRIVAAKDAGTSPFNLSNVAFVDMWFEAVLEDVDYIDGTHPNASGCEKIAAVWFSAIKQVLGTDGVKANLAIAEVFNSDATTLKVRLNKPVTLTEGATATLTGTETEATLSNLTLSEDGRVVTATASAELPTLTQLTLTLTGVQSVQSANETAPLTATFTALGSGAAANVPADYRAGFKHRKTVDLAADYTAATDIAEQDGVDAAETLSAIRRVAYYLELQRAGCPAQFVWVSMDAFASEEAMGVPTVARGNHQGKVTHLQVYGNRGNFTNTSAAAIDEVGIIEFTPYSYGTAANSLIDTEELYTDVYDWRDTLNTSGNGYGCMQVARITGEGLVGPTWAPAEMLFAFNGFNTTSVAADLGIGSFNTNLSATSGSVKAKTYDWTYATSSGIAGIAPGAYTVRKLEIWVEPGEPLTWGGAAEGEWNTTDGSVWAENKAFVAGDAVTFDALTAGTSATITVPEATFSSALTVSQNAYTFSGEGSLTASAVTLADNASATFNLPLKASSASVGEGATLTVKQGSFVTAPTGKGTFVKQGTIGSDDTTIDISSASNLLPMYTVESGKLTLTKSNSSDGAGYSSGTTPFFSVASGAHLVWNANDIVGWRRENTVKVAEISGVLEKTMNKNETFSGLLLLKNGGEVRNSGSADYFMLHNNAVIEVEEGASAKLTGNSFKSNNGTPILQVGEGATLTVEAPITVAASLTKKGKGLWIQAENGLTGSGLLTVAEGTLRFERANGAEIWVAGPITVEAGATLDIRKDLKRNSGATTINGTLTGNGLFYTSAAAASLSITASGRIVPTGALRLQVAGGVTVASGATIVANGNKLTCTNGLSLSDEGTITIEVPSAAPFSLEPTEIISNIGDLTAESFTVPTGYTLAKTETGALTLAITPPLKPEQGEGAAEDPTEWTTEAAQAILTLTGGTAPTTITATTKGGAQVLTAAEASAALEVFQNIAEAGADGTTVTVTYDFGIAEMIPDGDAIEVIAEVKSGEAVAELTEGTTLGLVLDDEASTPVADVSFAPVAGQPGKYRARVEAAKLTQPFKVRASR